MSQPPEDQVPRPAHALSDESPLVLDFDTIAWHPPSRRKRLVQRALVVVIVGVALVTLWRASPSLIGPSIAPTPAPPMVAVRLLSNVNFGTLLVNGNALAGHPPLTTRLPSQGTTVVTLNAPPFRPHSCTFIDLLAPATDPVHCALTYEEPAATSTAQETALSGTFAVGVFLTPDDLPLDQQSQVLALMSQPLRAPQQTTVLPGDYYATTISPDGILITSQTATKPLRATASFAPSKTAGPIREPQCGGQGICPWEMGLAPGLASHSWSLLFTEALRWQFTDTTGTPLADVSIPTMNIVGLILSYGAATGWQTDAVTPLLGTVQSTVCQAGIAALWFKAGGGNPAVPLHDRGVEGCELGLSINGVEAGRYVWRFGVLLTADAQAQSIMPGLPIASPAAIAAVGG